MWKVTNEVNKVILDDFRYKLIEPLFEEMIYYKKQSFSISFSENIKNGIDIMHGSSRSLINYVNKRKTKNVSFGKLIEQIISKTSLNELENYYSIFVFQNNEINNGNYNIKEEQISKEFKFLFVDFFYEMFFDYKKIWILIDKKKYEKFFFNRDIFHRNFKRENNIEICPYCDIDTTISVSNNEVEHFLPKSKFPFLSMNAYNLIPSCHTCNKKPEGKGTDVYMPIYSPYNMQIGDKLKFENDIVKRKIELSTDDSLIENYLKLLNLKSRYRPRRVYDYVEEKAESIYDTINDIEQIGNVSLTEKQIMDYIDKKCTKFDKKEPLSFAVKYAFSEYELYLRYRDKYIVD
ncbi:MULTISPECIES: hypothetical protein [Clostridium]|uniref:HNH endonuclease n=1 Tax=Clostridium TaxID=1485 RepID=UPI0013C98C2A|nr:MULTISPECIES: hypothetical protein [Clostridium]MBY7025164.1 hypothetical protein [Clostridium botulinum]NFI54156.1 hypothetical protein [Clostridium botulinum]NFN19589.1 hypothetical protein [Clostridium botulinum]NFN48527.1 hypothetical protein [Clostridium botulinum]NFO47380.1 hypothetical protein [Clostridium botulinum]